MPKGHYVRTSYRRRYVQPQHWAEIAVEKLPMFDPAWPDQMREAWLNIACGILTLAQADARPRALGEEAR